jgi:hypothetical protein
MPRIYKHGWRKQTEGEDKDLAYAILMRGVQRWPNDCPQCSARMKFDFQGSEPVRVCICGVSVRFDARTCEFVTVPVQTQRRAA